jgi:hypothetical protein
MDPQIRQARPKKSLSRYMTGFYPARVTYIEFPEIGHGFDLHSLTPGMLSGPSYALVATMHIKAGV